MEPLYLCISDSPCKSIQIQCTNVCACWPKFDGRSDVKNSSSDCWGPMCLHVATTPLAVRMCLVLLGGLWWLEHPGCYEKWGDSSLVGWDFRGRTAFIEFWQDIFSQSQDVTRHITRPNHCKDLMKFLSDVLTLQVLLMNFSRYNPWSSGTHLQQWLLELTSPTDAIYSYI